MKILVTGGSGFFGRNFLERCGDFHFVSAPTHKQLNLLDAASVQSYFKKDYFDAVVHLAKSYDISKKAGESDTMAMYKNLQREVIVNRIPTLIVIGSGSEYDERRDLSNVIEEEIGLFIPSSHNGVVSYLVNSLASMDKVTYNLRHFEVYGKYASPYNNTIAKLCYFALANRDIVLANDAVVSLIDIADSCKVIDAAVTGGLPKNDYNVVATKKYKLSQIARTIKTLTGGSFAISIQSKERGFEYTADNHRLISAMPLKFSPLKKGLEETLEYISDSFDEFNERKIKL